MTLSTLYYRGHTATKVRLIKWAAKVSVAIRDEIQTDKKLPRNLFRKTARPAPVEATFATFSWQVPWMFNDILITADHIGLIGNDILLVADGQKLIRDLINDWNTANPDNTCALTMWDGNQQPADQEEIQLSGWHEYIPNKAEGKAKAKPSAKAPVKTPVKKPVAKKTNKK